MNCNCKRLPIAILAAFACLWVTDFLIHSIWLAPTYGATKDLWRPEAEMMERMPYMFLGQFLIAVGFTTIYALFVAEKKSMSSTLIYAICAGIFAGATHVILYAIEPLPGSLVVTWFVVGILQLMLLGVVVSFVYKPLRCDNLGGQS